MKGLFTQYTWSEMELDIVLWLLKAFSNESSHEGLYPVKPDQTHNIPSSPHCQLRTAYSSVYSHRGMTKGYSISARMSSRRWESSMESSSLFSLNTFSWMSSSSVSFSSQKIRSYSKGHLAVVIISFNSGSTDKNYFFITIFLLKNLIKRFMYHC